jgi:hypothetical protein
MCALSTHRQEAGHDIQEIIKISDQKKEGMLELISSVNSTDEEVKEVIKVIGLEVTNVRELGKKVESEIDNAFDQYLQLFNKRRQELKNDVKRYVQIKAGTLENQLQNQLC